MSNPWVHYTFSDDAGNKLAVIAQANALTINYVDQTGPSVAGGGNATQISTTSCSITFDKKLNKTDAENIANYTIAKNDNPDVKLNVASALLDAAGTKVTLTVSTAVTNGYIYTITIKNVRDTFGNVIKSANSTATWAATASEDTTAPSLAGVAVKYTDVDSSKSITSGDTIEIFFNELMSIDFTKVTTADYAITGGRNLGASPAFQYGSGRNSVVITLGTAPTITWGDTITPAASSDFKDLAGNSATAVASGALTNPGSAPKISTISYADTNASGAVDAGDKLTIIYDRNITLPNGIAGLGATDFTLGGALNFGGSPVFELQNGNQIVVTLGGGGIAVDARTTTLDTIDEAATADIADVWGVTQLAADGTTAKVTSADRTSPSIASVAITKGTGNVGAALEANDKVTITLSEPAHKGAFTASEFALFTGATQLTYTGVTTDVAVAGNKVTITVKAGDGWVGTALSAITTFNFTTAAATVLDASGNVASPASGFGVSVTKP